MDLKKLNAIDVNNPAQVKELQQFLKARGYYAGPVDGKWGGKTTEGAVALRTDLAEENKTARDTALANERANDPANKAINMAIELGPYMAGAGLGAFAGHYGKKGLDSLDQRDAAEMKRIAANPKVSGQVAQQQMGRRATARRVRTGAQFLAPAVLLGSAEYMRSHIAPKFDKETEKWINLGANADQGAGLGLLAHQVFDLKNRIGSPVDAEDEAVIRSRASGPSAPPGGTPPPNASAAPKPNSQRLIAAARAAGATGKLNKTSAAAFLANNVTDANRAAVAKELGVGPGQKITTAIKRLAKPGSSAILLPLAAGAYAAGAAGNEARAEGAGAGETAARSGLAGLAAGGLTAGAASGMNKLAEVGARYAPTVARVAGRLAGPAGAGLAAYDVVQGINRLAHLSPPQDPREYSTMGAFMPPEGGNAMQQAGEQPDPFGAALDEFLRLAPEMQMQGGP